MLALAGEAGELPDQELKALLRESLPFVVVRSKSGESMSTAEYRERLHLVRSKYAPEERDLISGFVPDVGSTLASVDAPELGSV